MALINCPECGKENVSEFAITCPGCGFTIAKYFEEKKEAEKNLISCPECGKENISKLLSECPECGFPIASHFSANNTTESDKPQSNSSYLNNNYNTGSSSPYSMSILKKAGLLANKRLLISGLSAAIVCIVVLLCILLWPKTPLHRIAGSWHSTGYSVDDNYVDDKTNSFATLTINKDGFAVSKLSSGEEILFTVQEDPLPGVKVKDMYSFISDSNSTYNIEIIYSKQRKALTLLTNYNSRKIVIVFERD